MNDKENNDVIKEENDEISQEKAVVTKPSFELLKGDIAFVISAFVSSLFSAVFGLFSGYALGYMISVIIMMSVFSVYLIKGGKAKFLPVLCGVLTLANSAVFICTSNGSVRFFGVIVSFLLSIVCFDGFVNQDQKGNRKTIGAFFSAVSTLGNIWHTLKTLLTKGSGDKKFIGKALLGLVCSIPVLIIVMPLLISSDVAFQGLIVSIFRNTFVTTVKIIFGVLLSIFVICYGLSLKFKRFWKIKEAKFNGIESVYVISFLSAISGCYLLYLFSQLAYFFSAFKGFLPDENITYAQYARRGFFEMCIIAVINLGLVFLCLFIAKKRNGKVSHWVKCLTTFISSFTLVIIATAISKMVLYIDAYGMTVLRITTSAFMLLLAIVFIAVILRIYINKINVVKTALIASGCIILVLGTVNVNHVCAKYNYEAYKSKKLDTIDVEALYNLGDEGIPYVVKIACSKDAQAAQEAQKYLAEAYLYDYFDNMQDAQDFTVEDLQKNQKRKGFERFSIPKTNAYDALYKLIENNPQFASRCQSFFEDVEEDYFW